MWEILCNHVLKYYCTWLHVRCVRTYNYYSLYMPLASIHLTLTMTNTDWPHTQILLYKTKSIRLLFCMPWSRQYTPNNDKHLTVSLSLPNYVWCMQHEKEDNSYLSSVTLMSSPAWKVNSLSSAASKSYSARTCTKQNIIKCQTHVKHSKAHFKPAITTFSPFQAAKKGREEYRERENLKLNSEKTLQGL